MEGRQNRLESLLGAGLSKTDHLSSILPGVLDTSGQHSSQIKLNIHPSPEVQEKTVRVISYAYDTAGQKTAPGIILPKPDIDLVLDNEWQTIENNKVVRLCFAESTEERPKLEPLVISALTFDSKDNTGSTTDNEFIHSTCSEASSPILNDQQVEGPLSYCRTYFPGEGSLQGTNGNMHDDRSVHVPLLREKANYTNKSRVIDSEVGVPQCSAKQSPECSIACMDKTNSSLHRGQEVTEEIHETSGSSLTNIEGCDEKEDGTTIEGLETVLTSKSSTTDLEDSSGDEEGNEGETFQYACYLCSFMSKTTEEVMLHFKRKHIKQNPYLCAYCSLAFSNNYEAQTHIEQSHNGPILIQMPQSKIYSNPLMLEISKTGEMCEIKTENCTHFQLMEIQTSAKSNLSCPSAASASLKMRKDSLISRKFHCSKCNYKCVNECDIKTHTKVRHANFKPFHCQLCKCSFSCSDGLKKHLNSKHQAYYEHLYLDGSRNKIQGKSDSSPLPPNQITHKFSEPSLRNSNTVVIPTTELWQREVIGQHFIYHCKLCEKTTGIKPVAFKTREAVWLHINNYHNFPQILHCPTCLKELHLTQGDRLTNCVWCSECQMKVIFVGYCIMGNENAEKERFDIIYVCKECNYRSAERSSMTRHIKYYHTSCRPYACPHCEYVAVERPKVVHHALALHPDLVTNVLYREEEVEKFKSSIKELFKKFTFLCHLSSEDSSSQFANKTEDSSGQFANNREIKDRKEMSDEVTAERFASTELSEDSSVQRPSNKVTTNTVETENIRNNINFLTMTVKDYDKANHLKPKPGYKCKCCGYYSNERATVARHIRNKHLLQKAHGCSICNFTSAEKYKVNDHARYMHFGKEVKVITNTRLLQKLNEEVNLYISEENVHQVGVIAPLKENAAGRFADDYDRHTFLQKSKPVPRILVLNVHNKDNKAEITEGGDVLKINMSGYVRKEKDNNSSGCLADMTLVKEEPMEIDDINNKDITSQNDGIKKELPDSSLTSGDNYCTSSDHAPVKTDPDRIAMCPESTVATAGSTPLPSSSTNNVRNESTVDWDLPLVADSSLSIPVGSTIHAETGEEIPWTMEYYGSSDNAEDSVEVSNGVGNSTSQLVSKCVENNSNSMPNIFGSDECLQQKDETINCIVSSGDSMDDYEEPVIHSDYTDYGSPVPSNTSVNLSHVFNDLVPEFEEGTSAVVTDSSDSSSLDDTSNSENMDIDPKLHAMTPVVRLEDVIQNILGGIQ